MRHAVIVLSIFAATAAFGGDTPSIKQDFDDAGHSIESGVKGTYEKAKDETVNGVGTALEKTGEGLDKAGDKVEGAGETTKEKAE